MLTNWDIYNWFNMLFVVIPIKKTKTKNLCLPLAVTLCYVFISVGNSGLTWASLGGSANKESALSAGDPVLISGLGRSPGGGNGNPL